MYVGPPIEQLSKLFQLTSEPGLAAAFNPIPGPLFTEILPPLLLAQGVSAEEAAEFKARRLSEQWKKIRAVPAYRWLNRHESFREAKEIFLHKQKYRNANAALKSDVAELYFVGIVTFATMMFLEQSNPANRRRLPKKPIARRGLNCIRFLSHADLG